MDSESPNALNFEFGIVGEDLELSDDESMLSQVAVHALKAETTMHHKASITGWREDEVVQLQRFFEDLLRELQPRHDDYLARMNIVCRLGSVLEQMSSFKGTTLSTFGSFESNLFTRWADLDLSLELPDRRDLLQPVGKRVKVKILNAFSRTLIHKGEGCKVQFIPYARVPLVTFEDSKHRISCDVSVNNDSAFVKSRILRWICEIDTRCRDLIFLVKFWAKAHDINNPKQGTLNSFALCLLVVFHLQTRSPPLLPPLCAILDGEIGKRLRGSESSKEYLLEGYLEKIQPFIGDRFGAQNKSSVAELFITFINQFCAVKELWSQGLAVCTFTGAWGDPSCTSEKWGSKSYMIAIEDPFDRGENCGRSVQCKSFNSIVNAFTSTAEALSRPLVDTGLPFLLEALYLWPSDIQSLGLHDWLTKVLSKDEKYGYGQMNFNTVRGVPPSFSKKQLPYKFLRKQSVEAQLHKQVQLENPCPPVQIEEDLTRTKVSHCGPTATNDASREFESREQNESGRTDKKESKMMGITPAYTKETVSPSRAPSLVATKDRSISEADSQFDFGSVRNISNSFLPNHSFGADFHNELQLSNSCPVKKKKRRTRKKVSHGEPTAKVGAGMGVSCSESELKEQNNRNLGRIYNNSNHVIATTSKPAVTRGTIPHSGVPICTALEDGLHSEINRKLDLLSVRKNDRVEPSCYFVPNHPSEAHSHNIKLSNYCPPGQLTKKRRKKKVFQSRTTATVDAGLEVSCSGLESREFILDLDRRDQRFTNRMATRKPTITTKTTSHSGMPCWVAAEDGSALETFVKLDCSSFTKVSNQTAENSLPTMEAHSLLDESRQCNATVCGVSKPLMYPSKSHVEDWPAIGSYRDSQAVAPTESPATLPQSSSLFLATKQNTPAAKNSRRWGSSHGKKWLPMTHGNKVWKSDIIGHEEGARGPSAVGETNCGDERFKQF